MTKEESNSDSYLKPEVIKIRHHHFNVIYNYMFEEGKHPLTFSLKYNLEQEGYTESEYQNAMETMKMIKDLPDDVVIEVTAVEDVICDGCTRKYDPERYCNYSEPDEKWDPDKTISGNFDQIMDINIGDTYTCGELKKKMQEYCEAKDYIDEIRKELFDSDWSTLPEGRVPVSVSNIRDELLERGLISS